MIYMSLFNQRIRFFYSTEAALFTVTNDIMLSFDKGDNVCLVYWICQQHLIPLTIPCRWYDGSNHLPSVYTTMVQVSSFSKNLVC